jgi:alkane 1-monooxygenase
MIFRVPMYILPFLQHFVYIFICYEISFTLSENFYSNYFWFIFNFGIISGSSLALSHELIHKNGIHKMLAQISLITIFDMHFEIDHIEGHHKLVATPEDPVTARFNETIYQFYFRSVIEEYLHSWKLENQKIQKKKLYFIENKMIYYTLLPILYHILLVQYFGLVIIPFVVMNTLIAHLFQSIINYIEHYGK